MFMNRKLLALWNKIQNKVNIWRKARRQAAHINGIAKELSAKDMGQARFESTAQWGVSPNQLSSYVVEKGNHCVEKGVYIRADGSPLFYPMKFKHNDGTVNIIKVLSKEQITKLATEHAASQQTKAEEAAYETYRNHGGYKSKDEFLNPGK